MINTEQTEAKPETMVPIPKAEPVEDLTKKSVSDLEEMI